MSLEERLDKIRSPKLQNQRETAVVLAAVEETLRSQSLGTTPTAYFAALLALLGQSAKAEDGVINRELATSVVYLLDLFTSHVPAPLLRSKFTQIVTSLAPILAPDVDAEAPLLRSSIGCVESLLIAQDYLSWNLPSSQIGPRQAISSLLVLAQDHRPKVRKRSQDAIVNILQHRPASPSLDHPAADMCAEAAMKALISTYSQEKETIQKSRADNEAHHPRIFHALQLVKAIASASGGWPVQKMDALAELLLKLSRQQNAWLTVTAFEIFEMAFQGLTKGGSSVANAKLPLLIASIEELRPGKEDERLVPSWCAVVSRAYDVLQQVASDDSSEVFQSLPKIFGTVAEYCASENEAIRISASECLVSFLVNCIPDNVILEPTIYDEKVLEKLANSGVELLSVKFQAAWKEALKVLAVMFSTYRWQSSIYLSRGIKTVANMRDSALFRGKEEADTVLGAAIQAAGPEAVLQIVPLNLVRQTKTEPGRAWLLPLLREHVQNTHLKHFTTHLAPLSESLYSLVLEHGKSEKSVEIKIYETLVQQIWATLPGYCTFALDIPTAFSQAFAESISNLLYKQADLRTEICRALNILVESMQIIASSDDPDSELLMKYRMSKTDAQKSLDHLAAYASNLLAVLFNIYSETLPQYRGFILQCINAYLSITPEKELIETFERVAVVLESVMKELDGRERGPGNSKTQISGSMPPTSHTLMDLLITISIYLPRTAYPRLFSLAAIALPLNSDPQLQKKAYKLLPRLASSPNSAAAIRERNLDLQNLLSSVAGSVSAAARRDRLEALTVIVRDLPSTDLHYIPTILSEVTIACKEVNEKARGAAFDLLVLMCEKMSSGGTVEQSRIPHMEPSAPTVQASLEEFFTMVSAGLVGSTPHMVSASIIALTRILYEYHTKLPSSVVEDLVQTMDLFLTSANREIVRSVLGFVKVAIVSLSTEIVSPHLMTLVPGLIGWSKEHKARFRSKVKNILERIMRRFGYDVVQRHCPEDDQKLIQNIRKTRERRKKKKMADEETDHAEPGHDARSNLHGKSNVESEFDKAIYGSEDSSLGSAASDDEQTLDEPRSSNKQRTKDRSRSSTSHNADPGSFISEKGDEPLDLLDTKSLGHITSSKPGTHRKQMISNVLQHNSRTNIDGKLVIRDDDAKAPLRKVKQSVLRDEDAMSIDDTGKNDDLGGIDAYMEAVSGRDAVQRGQRGRLKYSNRREKKRVSFAEPDGDEDVEGRDGQSGGSGRGGRVTNGRGSARGMERGRFRGGGGRIARGGISKRVQRRGLGASKSRGDGPRGSFRSGFKRGRSRGGRS